MNFSDQKEDVGGGFTPKDIYLGKASYKIVAVNPNKEELKALGQFVPEDEPSYIGKREINGQEFPLANITIYLQNPSNVNIIDRVTYSVIDNVQESTTGKLAILNKYGNDAWLEKVHIDSKTLPDNMQWFLNEGIKPAKRGEKELVTFIRALRNFKKINKDSTPEDREGYVSQFEESDLQKLFKGDFSDIKKLLMSNADLKVGFLLGARTRDDGKVYQDIYKEYPLRPYMVGNDGSNEYITKAVRDSQDNGRYANTYFDLNDLSYKKYDASAKEVPVADLDDQDNDLPF